MLVDPEVAAKYQYVVAKLFVASNNEMTWCPAPGCEYAVRVDKVCHWLFVYHALLC